MVAEESRELLPRKQEQERAERDYEDFLKEIEEDTELRQTLALYKNTKKNPPKSQRMEGVEIEGGVSLDQQSAMDEDEEEEDVDSALPEIGMDELLDEFEEMNVGDEA